MKEYTLTPEQENEISNYLKGVEGAFSADFDFDDIYVEAEGYVHSEGYREDDYFNGTGAWVETKREQIVNLYACDENGEEIKIISTL